MLFNVNKTLSYVNLHLTGLTERRYTKALQRTITG